MKGVISETRTEPFEAFGTRRAMFASDFPVAGLHAGYTEMYDVFATITADLGETEQRRLFAENARQAYRIDKLSTQS